MKTRSVNSGFWFWHKGCVKAMTFCNRTDSKFGSHQLICRPKCCSRTEIQFVLATTAKVLETPCFTTDSILNLEERTGRKGTFINVYRYIMYYYSHIPQQVLDEYNKNTETQQDDLFRIVMKLNTAKVMVVDPALYLGGEKEYVRSLFMDSGVRV